MTWAWTVTRLVTDHEGHVPGMATARFLAPGHKEMLQRCAELGAPTPFQHQLASSLGIVLNSKQLGQLAKGRAENKDPCADLDKGKWWRYICMYKHVDANGKDHFSYRFKFGPEKSQVERSCTMVDLRASTSLPNCTQEGASVESPLCSLPSGTVWFHGLVLATEDSIAEGRQFPEAFSIDVTLGTNSASKPFVPIVGVNGNLKNFSVAYAFLDGETKADFSFLFAALEKLIGNAWMRSIHVISTDGDKTFIDLIDALHAEGKFHPKFCRLRDRYHLIYQNYMKSFKPSSPTAQTIGQTIVRWLRTWHSHVEDETNLEESREKMVKWLAEMASSNRLSAADHGSLAEIISTVYNQRGRFALYQTKNLVTLGHHGTSRSEAENSVIKHRGSKKITSNTTMSNVVRRVAASLLQRENEESVSLAQSQTRGCTLESLYSVIVQRQCSRNIKFDTINGMMEVPGTDIRASLRKLEVAEGMRRKCDELVKTELRQKDPVKMKSLQGIIPLFMSLTAKATELLIGQVSFLSL